MAPVIEGVLSKKSGRGALGLGPHSWQRRFFSLTEDALTYSVIGSSSKRLELRGRIALSAILRVESPHLQPHGAAGGGNSSSQSRGGGGGGGSRDTLANTLSSTVTAAFGLQDERQYFNVVLVGEDRGQTTGLGPSDAGRVFFLMADSPELARQWVLAIDRQWRVAAENSRIRSGEAHIGSAGNAAAIPDARPLQPLYPAPSAPPVAGNPVDEGSETPPPPASTGGGPGGAGDSQYTDFLSFVDGSRRDPAEPADPQPSAPPLPSPELIRNTHPSSDWTVGSEEAKALLFSEPGLELYLAEMEECCKYVLESFLPSIPNVQKHLLCVQTTLRQLQYDNIEASEHLPLQTRHLLLPTGEAGAVGDILHAAVAVSQNCVLREWTVDGPTMVARIDTWLSRRQQTRRSSDLVTRQQIFLRGDCETSIARILATADLVQRRYLHQDVGATDAGNTFFGRELLLEAVAKVVYQSRVLLVERPVYFFPALLTSKLGFASSMDRSLMLFGLGADKSLNGLLTLLVRCSLVFQQLQMELGDLQALKGMPSASSAFARVATAFQLERNADKTSLGPAAAVELGKISSLVREHEMRIFPAWSQREGGSSKLLADAGECDSGCCSGSSESSEPLRRYVLLLRIMRILKRLALTLTDSRLRQLQTELMICALEMEKVGGAGLTFSCPGIVLTPMFLPLY
jgi:PH domain